MKYIEQLARWEAKDARKKSVVLSSFSGSVIEEVEISSKYKEKIVNVFILNIENDWANGYKGY